MGNRREPNKSPLMSSRSHLDWKEFACGWGAAFVNIFATYPIFKVTFRQMLHGVTLQEAYKQVVSEGYIYLYRGMLPPLAQKTISMSLMFGVFDATRRPLEERFHFTQFNSKLVAGFCAGSVEAVLMPFERIQTLLADRSYHRYFRNTPEAFRYVFAIHGCKELYRGLIPILLRNGPSNAAFFILREDMCVRLPPQTGIYATLQHFACGALIGAFISTVVYPLNVIKIASQSVIGGPYVNVVTQFLHIYNERNRKLRHFYKGAGMNFTRAFLSWGLINASYEMFKSVVY